MAFFFFVHSGLDEENQIFVTGVFAQQTSHIVIVFAEKAGTQFAVRSQAYARAVPAEGLGDRSNQTDFTWGTVREAILARSFAGFIGNLLERPARVNTFV